MNEIRDWLIGLALVVTLLTAWALAGAGDYEEAVRAHNQYCDMVEIWHESGGEHGWPPYKEDAEC